MNEENDVTEEVTQEGKEETAAAGTTPYGTAVPPPSGREVKELPV